MAEFKKYFLWLGTFEKDKFVWKKLKEFNDYDKAYAAYRKFVEEQTEYTDEELIDIWNSPRLDIELKDDQDKLINWVGIYFRKKGRPEPDDQDEEEESTKDCSFGPRL